MRSSLLTYRQTCGLIAVVLLSLSGILVMSTVGRRMIAGVVTSPTCVVTYPEDGSKKAIVTLGTGNEASRETNYCIDFTTLKSYFCEQKTCVATGKDSSA